MSAASTPEPPLHGAARRRAGLLIGAAAVASTDLVAKAWAQQSLPPSGVEVGPVDFVLAYNPGIAFSVAADAPRALVITITSAITLAVAAVAWRVARESTQIMTAALAAILGGAVANVVDRAGDGVVTDYLHTGWWPTFNLADAAIVTGAALLVLTSWQRPTGRNDDAQVPPADARRSSPA